MSRRVDFRTSRNILPPEAFAISEGPDRPPSDLIKEDVWYSIVSLPDDVSMRTSSNNGGALEVMDALWGSWIESCGEKKDPIWYPMLDAGDEFQASIFNSLCGFYRVAAECLRTALELVIIGTYFQLSLGKAELLKWMKGQRDEVGFGHACDMLPSLPAVRPLDTHLKSKLGRSMFEQRTKVSFGGWARRLYSDLSGFTHSQPDQTSSAMWEGSNGPIYIAASFSKIIGFYLETLSIGFVLVKLARPTFSMPKDATNVFKSPSIRPSRDAAYAFKFLFP